MFKAINKNCNKWIYFTLKIGDGDSLYFHGT